MSASGSRQRKDGCRLCDSNTRHGRCCAVLGFFALLGTVFALRVAVGAVINATTVDIGSEAG